MTGPTGSCRPPESRCVSVGFDFIPDSPVHSPYESQMLSISLPPYFPSDRPKQRLPVRRPHWWFRMFWPIYYKSGKLYVDLLQYTEKIVPTTLDLLFKDDWKSLKIFIQRLLWRLHVFVRPAIQNPKIVICKIETGSKPSHSRSWNKQHCTFLQTTDTLYVEVGAQCSQWPLLKGQAHCGMDETNTGLSPRHFVIYLHWLCCYGS